MSPYDSLPPLKLVLLVTCKTINDLSGVPTTSTLMPKSVKILWIVFAISKLKDACKNTWRSSLIYRLVVTDLLEFLKPNWTRSLSPSLFEPQPYLQEI
jgi:hypothetical protein